MAGEALNVFAEFPTLARGENANALTGDATVAAKAKRAIFFITAMVDSLVWIRTARYLRQILQ